MENMTNFDGLNNKPDNNSSGDSNSIPIHNLDNEPIKFMDTADIIKQEAQAPKESSNMEKPIQDITPKFTHEDLNKFHDTEVREKPKKSSFALVLLTLILSAAAAGAGVYVWAIMQSKADKAKINELQEKIGTLTSQVNQLEGNMAQKVENSSINSNPAPGGVPQENINVSVPAMPSIPTPPENLNINSAPNIPTPPSDIKTPQMPPIPSNVNSPQMPPNPAMPKP